MLYINRIRAQKIIQYEVSVLPFVIHPQSNHARGQVQPCHNITASLFEKQKSPCKQEFPEKKSGDKYPITIYQASVISLHITEDLLLKLYQHRQIKPSTAYKRMIRSRFLKSFQRKYQEKNQHQSSQKQTQFSQIMFSLSFIVIFSY